MARRQTMKAKIFSSVTEAIGNLLKIGLGFMGNRLGKRVAARLSEQMIPILNINTDRGPLAFFCPGNDILLFRAESLLSKEPETIEWIDTFKEGDVFWDIGANVGVYSLYAALHPSITVLSFEPAFANYYVLNRNIELNRKENVITSFCLAFTDRSTLDSLFMSNTDLGGAIHSFGQEINFHGIQPSKFRQGMIGFSIDDFVAHFQPVFPNHIKIDVDGIEDKILNGGGKTLSDNRLRSLLVELDIDQIDYCRHVISMLESCGLMLYTRKHSPMFDNGPYATIYNHIFVRPQ